MTPEFTPPGPGQWALDRSHYPGGATPISQWLLREGFSNGFRRVFAEVGLPADTIACEFVHGFMYTRLQPLIGANRKPRRPPPAAILKALTRLHPEFRARNKTAIAALRDRPSNDVLRRWEEELRPQLRQSNVDFQNFDVAAANNVELQSHITELLEQLRSSFELHFWLHGHDLGPVARLLHTCRRWGLEPDLVVPALAGASPTTAEPTKMLVELRGLLDASREPIATLDEFQASSPEADALVRSYLRERGYLLATGYDLDNRTLIEMPRVVFNSIRSASPPPRHDADGIASELRNHLSASRRAEFDLLLGDARNVMDMRDDNGPLTIEWPIGLLRRALLDAGRRLVERSCITAPHHLFDLSPGEALDLFGVGLPSAAVLVERVDKRQLQSNLEAPALLGPAERPPPLHALPPALVELIATVQVAQEHVGTSASIGAEKLSGIGIGDVRYVGVARVALTADEAFDRLDPGDVLIVRATSPAFNAVLSIAGAVVTSDGGMLSHAAVLSRELGIPAIIGVPGALLIQDGSTIEVDATAGLIRVVAPA
ncbi:MAG: phosphohistidine swiveling domain-containing protein [Paracrocinitomix sp.]|jgi:phosphohistidine swiveling domain-containing protein